MNCMELFHAAPESYRFRGFMVAVPTPKAGDDPTGPSEASSGVRVVLTFGLSFECRAEHFEGVDLGLPQPLDENIVQKSPFAVHADPHALTRKLVQERGAGKLHTLIGQEQLGLSLFHLGTIRKPKLAQYGEVVVSEARAVTHSIETLRARVRGFLN
jgi:hypothetical protein